MSYLLNCVNCYLERWIGLQYGGGRPASFYFILFIFFLAKMASNWGCALSSNAPYSRINTVYDIEPCCLTTHCTKDYTIYQRVFSISYDVITVL